MLPVICYRCSKKVGMVYLDNKAVVTEGKVDYDKGWSTTSRSGRQFAFSMKCHLAENGIFIMRRYAWRGRATSGVRDAAVTK